MSNNPKKPKVKLSAAMAKNAGVIPLVMPRGEVLTLKPTGDWIFISPADPSSDPLEIGGIIVDRATASLGYARVKVLAIGPDVETIVVGDEIIVLKPQCDKMNFDGNDYWRTRPGAVFGIVQPKDSKG